MKDYNDSYQKLIQDKYITSYDISSKDYSDDMIMNFYLFNRLIINQDEVYNLDTMDAIKLLHDNHCIAVLAHPLLIKTDKCNYKNIMKEFDGIEVFYAYMNEYGRYKRL